MRKNIEIHSFSIESFSNELFIGTLKIEASVYVSSICPLFSPQTLNDRHFNCSILAAFHKMKASLMQICRWNLKEAMFFFKSAQIFIQVVNFTHLKTTDQGWSLLLNPSKILHLIVTWKSKIEPNPSIHMTNYIVNFESDR